MRRIRLQGRRDARPVLEEDTRAGHLLKARVADALAEQPAPGQRDQSGHVEDRLRMNVHGRTPTEGEVREPFQHQGRQDDADIEGDPEDLGRDDERQIGNRTVDRVLRLEKPLPSTRLILNLGRSMTDPLALKPARGLGHERTHDVHQKAMRRSGAAPARLAQRPGRGDRGHE